MSRSLLLSALFLVACAEATQMTADHGTTGGDSSSTGATGGTTSGTGSNGSGGTGGNPSTDSTPASCDPSLPNINGCPCDMENATRGCYTGPVGTENVGACKDGKQTCVMNGEFLIWGDCTGDVTPATEVCSQTNDENCNGKLGCDDPSCTGIVGCCTSGTMRSCYDGPNGTAGVGVCKSGTQTCDSTGAWQGCMGETVPSTEVGHCADGLDNDCDGLADCNDPKCANDIACKPPICAATTTRSCYDGAMGTEGVGACHAGTNTCAADGQSWSTTCAGEVVPSGEAGHCHDGVDNDCNGTKDCEDPACNGDPGCFCTPGATRPCYPGPVNTEGVGICHAGTQTCNAGGSAWSACTGYVVPTLETGLCSDGKDNDCDGLTDCDDSSCTLDPVCCVPITTYDATIYATSGTSLYKIDPTDWSETQIGTYGVDSMTDLAMTPDGNVYTISSTALYHINLTTGAATKVMTVTGSLNNALTFLPDNRLLAADASGMLKVIDPVAKTVSNVGSYSNGYGSSGDLVAVDDGSSSGIMFGISATAAGGGDISSNNLLITVDTGTGKATPVGQIGYGNVFGLAYYKSRVIAFTGQSGTGRILEINPSTGAATLLATHNHNYFGGTVSPLIPINGCR